MIDIQRLKTSLQNMNVQLEDAVLSELDTYCEAVVKTNEQFNLTAITNPQEMEEKNLLDCLALLSFLPQEGKLADVGTGAGFPGAVLKIARPKLQLTLIEATGKKLNFVHQTLSEMGYSSEAVHLRGEEAARGNYREQFDVVTARAVAALPTLLEVTLPLVKIGGRFLAMKGSGGEEELAAAKKALSILGGEVEKVHTFSLPTFGERMIIVVRKTKETPPSYPRNSGAIKKKPL